MFLLSLLLSCTDLSAESRIGQLTEANQKLAEENQSLSGKVRNSTTDYLALASVAQKRTEALEVIGQAYLAAIGESGNQVVVCHPITSNDLVVQHTDPWVQTLITTDCLDPLVLNWAPEGLAVTSPNESQKDEVGGLEDFPKGGMK